jgi:DNA repair protein RecN (Recombination protein N)
VIEELRIRCLGVIDDAVLEFSPGLTVVTGETGAGKTMVVTGLGLLLGSRADAGQVRRGADKATVEGSFQVGTDGSVGERIAAAGGSVEDDVAVLVRTVNAQGRSRAHVGGATAPVSVLGELAPALVTVHGQADQQRLLQPARQRELLDAYAASGNDLASYRTLFTELTEIERALAALVAERQARAQEADLLRFGLSEIADVDPQPGEDVTLRAEDQRLSHAEELHQAATTARSMLDSDDDGAVNALLARGRRALEAVRDHDPELGAISDRMAEVGYLAADLAADLTSYTEGAEVDPRRLAAISDRRAALAHLTRKYGSSVDEVLQWAEASAQRLEQLDATDDDVQRLTDELGTGRTELARRAAALSKRRTAAARRLEKRVTQELKELAMPDASLAVEVRQVESDSGLLLPDGRTVRSGQDGIDEVTILLRPHTDAPAQPLAKGASGGELSRVMLAVEVVLAGADEVPTFVFDEVDAGVGGRAAVEVGRRLAGLARTAQVIVVTHLPQVAAFADRHLAVTKSSSGLVTSSGVTVLDDQGRAKELARMLAGLEDSALGQAHAAELMDLAAADKQARG